MKPFGIAILRSAKTREHADYQAREILDLFDQGSSVPLHPEICCCLKMNFAGLDESANERLGTLQARWRQFLGEVPGRLDKDDRESRWLAFDEPYRELLEDAIRSLPKRDQPSAKCRYCSGTGIEYTRANAFTGIFHYYDLAAKDEWIRYYRYWPMDFFLRAVSDEDQGDSLLSDRVIVTTIRDCRTFFAQMNRRLPTAVIDVECIWHEEVERPWRQEFDRIMASSENMLVVGFWYHALGVFMHQLVVDQDR